MTIVRADALRSKASGSITNAYTTIGSAITHNWRTACFINNTDGDMFISFDGTTDNLFIPKNGFRLYDLATNAVNVQDTDNFLIGINQQFYIKYSTVPSTGAFYIEGLYAIGG